MTIVDCKTALYPKSLPMRWSRRSCPKVSGGRRCCGGDGLAYASRDISLDLGRGFDQVDDGGYVEMQAREAMVPRLEKGS